MKISVITALVGLAAAAADPRCSIGDPQCLMTEEGGDIGSLLQPKGDDVVSMMQVRASVVGNGPVETDAQIKTRTCSGFRRRYDKNSNGLNWARLDWWECERVLRPATCGDCPDGFRPITTGQFKESQSGGTLTSFKKMCGQTFSNTPYNPSTPRGNFCLNGSNFTDANSTCADKIKNVPLAEQQEKCHGACTVSGCSLTGCSYNVQNDGSFKCEATQCCCVKVAKGKMKEWCNPNKYSKCWTDGFVAVGGNDGSQTCVYGNIER